MGATASRSADPTECGLPTGVGQGSVALAVGGLDSSGGEAASWSDCRRVPGDEA